MNSRKVAIKIEQLSYSYKTQWLYKKVAALKDLNLELYEGEAFGFLGHNGAGKTTTIKCILNLVHACTGKISIFGEDYHLAQARRQIGYVPEHPYFYDHLSVYEIMDLYACLAGVSSADRPAQIEAALKRLDMLDRSKSPMRSLSKGLTQRVAMAQAILANPRILILDEPFSGLDPLGRKQFRDLILELKNSGTTIFLSSHVLSDVEYICDRVSITVKGCLQGIWTIKDIQSLAAGGFELVIRGNPSFKDSLSKLADQVHLKADCFHATFSNRQAASQALKLAIEAGMQIDSFSPLHSSLEDLFMRVVTEKR